MSNLSNLLERLQNQSLGSVLSQLRELHASPPEQRVALQARGGSDALASGPLGPALDLVQRARRAMNAEAPPDAESAILGARPADIARMLESALLGEDLAAGTSSSLPPDADDDGRGGSRRLRESPRGVLRSRERRLRRQEALTKRILDQMEGGSTVTALPRRAPLQGELRIACPVGGTSGGRFLLRNEIDRSVRVELRVRALHAVPGSLADKARITTQPGQIDLAAGEERMIRVAVDLEGAAYMAGEAEIVIDAIAEDEVLHKLWVTVLARPEGDAERGR